MGRVGCRSPTLLDFRFWISVVLPVGVVNVYGAAPVRPSALLDTRVIYCGDNLEQLRKLPDACVDLIYIDPPFNSNRN